MKTIIGNLQANPIFRMSLGSKELFHSNFLEYLWSLNPDLFVKMVNRLLPPCNKLPKRSDYELGREQLNFDICLYHKNNNKYFYDLVIENKVKSIPYKEQLNDYVAKANKNNQGCQFLLLTLSDSFPDKGDPSISAWTVIGYNQLLTEIEYFKKEYISLYGNDKHICYIDDYCEFIRNLDALKKFIIPSNTSIPLFEQTIINDLKSVRLHDLDIKLRSAWFALQLRDELKQKGITPTIIHSFGEMKTPGLYLNVAMNRVCGQIAAWICDRNMNVFEIVIQGDQYRHGINQRNVSSLIGVNEQRLNNCYSRLLDPLFSDAKSFLDFSGNGNVQPSGRRYFKKKDKKMPAIQKSGPFDNYDDSYIYRYIKCGGMTIDFLKAMMVTDICNIYHNIPILQ